MVVDMLYKQWIVSLLKGKKVHFWCDCIVKLDIEGVVVDSEVVNSEVVFYVKRDEDAKVIKIGENTPKLNIEIK